MPAPPDRSELADSGRIRRDALRTQARLYVAHRTVNVGDGAVRPQVLAQLDAALAVELACIARYRRHHFLARCAQADAVADKFLVHAVQEQQHADWLAGRIA